MILYKPLWETMKKRGISQYSLINKHGISNATLGRIRKGKNISTPIINDLCRILECTPNDIMVYVDEEEEE